MSRNNDGKARGNSQRDPSYNQASHTKERLAVPKAQMVTGPRTGYCVYEIWAADPHHRVTDGILEHVEDGWSLLMRATSPDLEVSLESPSVIEYTPWFCFEEKQFLRVDCSCYVRSLWWTDEESFIDANITMVLTSKTLCWTVDDRTIKTRWLIPTHSVLLFLKLGHLPGSSGSVYDV